MSSKFLDLLENKVECEPGFLESRENYDNFRAAYRFISPILSMIDLLECRDNGEFLLIHDQEIENKENGLKELIDKSSVRIGESEYLAKTEIIDDHTIKMNLVTS